MSGMLYVIGQPGAGKTTAVKAMWQRSPGRVVREGQMGWTDRTDPEAADGLPEYAVELGWQRDTFGGTDALGMGVQPHAVAWATACTADLIVGEGDRLANQGFLTAVAGTGRKVLVVFVAVDDQTAAARRAARGTSQAPTWVKGRQTKARNLAHAWHAARVDGRQPPEAVAEQLRRHAHSISW